MVVLRVLVFSRCAATVAVDAQAPVGGEWNVTDSSEGTQSIPDLAISRAGTLAVVWEDFGHFDGDGNRLREFSSAGAASSEIRFDDAGLSPGRPSVAFSPHGGLALAWHSTLEQGGTAFYGRLRGAGEEGVGASAAWVTSAPDLLSVSQLDLEYARSGSIVLAFAGDVGLLDETERWAARDVFVTEVDGAGAPLFPRVRVNEYRAGIQDSVAVAADPEGWKVVVWRDQDGHDGSGSGIYARRLAPDGSPVGSEFRVNQETELNQIQPEIDMDVEGNFVVVWAGKEQDGLYFDVFARRYSPSGEALGDEFVVNQFRAGTQWAPSVSMDSYGNFVVVWAVETHADPHRIAFARSYDSNGLPLGDEYPVDSEDSSVNGDGEFPAVALSDSGALGFAFQRYVESLPSDDAYDVRLRRFVWPCRADESSVCLAGRFLVRAQQETPDAQWGVGRAVPLSVDSGAFWFFSPGNLELVVKVLDGCPVNGRFWVYAAGLTDRRVDLEVTDTWAGIVWHRSNAYLDRFPAIQDVEAFATCGAENPAGRGAAPGRGDGVSPAPPSPGPDATNTLLPAPAEGAAIGVNDGDCRDDATHLCVTRGRFRVSARYRLPNEESRDAQVLPFGEDSGVFWFFEPSNLELYIKVLDACHPFERFWVYAAGLTNLEVHLTVEDTVAGSVRTYVNPMGVPFSPVHDASAFATCSEGPGGLDTVRNPGTQG